MNLWHLSHNRYSFSNPQQSTNDYSIQWCMKNLMFNADYNPKNLCQSNCHTLLAKKLQFMLCCFVQWWKFLLLMPGLDLLHPLWLLDLSMTVWVWGYLDPIKGVNRVLMYPRPDADLKILKFKRLSCIHRCIGFTKKTWLWNNWKTNKSGHKFLWNWLQRL